MKLDGKIYEIYEIDKRMRTRVGVGDPRTVACMAILALRIVSHGNKPKRYWDNKRKEFEKALSEDLESPTTCRMLDT